MRCGHVGCRLTSTLDCCECCDARPHQQHYQEYVDGSGYVSSGTRHQHYCEICRSRCEQGGGGGGGVAEENQQRNRGGQHDGGE